nr:F-box protein [Nitrosopumilus sp.]
MSLVINQRVSNSYSCEDFNETKKDSIEILPDDLVMEIFSHTNFATLGTICCVIKQWKQLANEPIIWKIAIYR